MVDKTIRIGMGQMLVEGGEPERNLTRAKKMIKGAAAEDCQIVLLPECLDLAWTHPSAAKEALEIPGKYSDILCTQAQDNNIYVCAGLTEKDGAKVYNTAVFIDPNGRILLKYRKINVLDVGLVYYDIGTSLAVIDTPLGRIGVNICSDNYPDGLCIGHTLARMGAQLILSPSSWTSDYAITESSDPYGDKWVQPYSNLAKLYNLVVVGTTSVGMIIGGPYEGKKMIGCSLMVNKDGILARGKFNEYAGELIVGECIIPQRDEQGTNIGKMLLANGYQFDGVKKKTFLSKLKRS